MKCKKNNIIKKLSAVLTASALLLTGCSGAKSSTQTDQDLTYTDMLFDTVIKIQILYSELSGGAFDLTIEPVSALWDFKADKPTVPSSDAIAQAVSHVDYTKVDIRDNTVTLEDPEAGIDLGAIAKGYIADQVKTYLKKQGIKHAIINLGGNVDVIGTKPDGSKYNIGIQKPFDESGEAITSVQLKDQTVVTSGIYERYFKKNGKLYHHILDPRTGYPCENNLHSVSIITDSSTKADALSTTCFLLGYEKGMELIQSMDGVEAIFITDDEKVHKIGI